MMRITIICDGFHLEDVEALGHYLRNRYKDNPQEISVLVACDQFPAAEAAAALTAIFEGDPHWTQILHLPKKGNGK